MKKIEQKGNRRPRETAPGHSQKLKQVDDNGLERKLRLETATKRIRLAMEMDKERKAKLEKMVATERLRLAMEKIIASEWLRLAMETDEERKARLERVATTHPRLALETEEEKRARLEHLSDNPIYYLSTLPYIIVAV